MEKLIQDNMGLVYKQLHKFNLAYNDDAVSYGMEALWRAAETYDSTKGTKFSTYATSCIYNAIMLYFRDNKDTDYVSYEEEIYEGHTLLDTLAYIEQDSSDVMEAFSEVFSSLSNDMHKDVIAYWYKSDFKATQSEIAAEYNLSQSQVSRILSAFKNKLKEEISCKKSQK